MSKFENSLKLVSSYFNMTAKVDSGTLTPVFVFISKKDQNINYEFVVTSESIENYNANYNSPLIENMFNKLQILIRDKRLDEII